MTTKHTQSIVLFRAGMLLAACTTAGPVFPTPTITPEPTHTRRPTFTPASTRTRTPTPREVATATFAPEVESVREYVPDGGFSFVWQIRFTYEKMNNVVNLYDDNVVIVLAGEYNDLDQSTDEIIHDGLERMFKDSSYQVISKFDNTIAGAPARGAVFTGTYEGFTVDGEFWVAFNQPDHYLVPFAMGATTNGLNLWLVKGRNMLHETLDSIQFDKLEFYSNGSACPVSTDPTYGFTQDNPIKVGGSEREGAWREQVYLDNLLGSGGAVIEYTHNGTITYGDSTLDEYTLSITDTGAEQTIYIDKYSYDEVMAPKGFICAATIPFHAP